MLTIPLSLLLLHLNSFPAVNAGNPYGPPPQLAQLEWQQRSAAQWAAPNWAQPSIGQQQQYPQYPQYRVPVPVHNPIPAPGQGCYTYLWCPPMPMSTAEPTSTTSITTTIDGGEPGTATFTQTSIASSSITSTSTEAIQTSSSSSPTSTASSSSSPLITTIESTSVGTTTETTSATTSTTSSTPTTTVAAGTCNSTTPANATSIFLEDASNATSYQRNGTPYLGNCTCPLASELTKELYASQLDPRTIFPHAIRIECGRNYSTVCICAESGECFRQEDTIRFIEMQAYCNAGECHSYIELFRGSLLGDRGTVFQASQQTGQLGPDSPYVKAVSVSCLGCAKLQQAVLC